MKAYLELSKIRMVPMVLLMAVYGFFLTGQGINQWVVLFFSLVGIACVSAGSAALNNYLEKDTDSKMPRTQNRVLPQGQLTPLAALVFGVSLVLFGVFVLAYRVNLLTAFLMLLASFLYVLVYTPMKRWSWWNTFVGAVPGAIPPMAGWTAASGELHAGAWILFLLLYTWQIPHFYAIAILYRKDYQMGGLKMLPVIDEHGLRVMRQIVVFCLLMVLVSVLPTTLGMAGKVYILGALVAGILFSIQGILLAMNQTEVWARRLFHGSLVYLPLLFVLFLVDKGW